MNQTGMYVMVMFDMLTDSKNNKKLYTTFRKTLLTNGFLMLQYSVYYRYCVSIDMCSRCVTLMKKLTPNVGKIRIFSFTEQQFRSHIIIDNGYINDIKQQDIIIQI